MEVLRIFLLIVIFACGCVIVWYFFFSQSAGNRVHLRQLRRRTNRVDYLRAVWLGEVEPVNREANRVLQMSEYQLNHYLAFTVMGGYEDLQLTARRMWSDYLRKLDARAAGKSFTVATPTPDGAKVIYLDTQRVTTPTPIGEGANQALTMVLHEAKIVPINRHKKRSYVNN